MVSYEVIYHIDLTETNEARRVSPLPLQGDLGTAVYNPDEDRVYYAEGYSNSIKWASLDGSNEESLLWFPSEYSLQTLILIIHPTHIHG